MVDAALDSTARRSVPEAKLDRALDPIRAAVASDLLPSAVVGVSDAQGTVFVRAIAGREHRTVTPDRLYFLASVTKPIVAAAVMQLVDEGRLDLDAPFARVLPEYSGDGRELVTARHVLTHTAGLKDIDQDVLRRERPPYARILGRVMRSTPAWEPGSRYAYCSDSFYLLAEAITRLTGMPFPVALRRRVLAPLGMSATTFDVRRETERVMPVRGIPLGNPVARWLILRFLARATLPGGGLFGPVEDVLRFGRAMLPRPAGADQGEGAASSRILSQAAIDEMTRDQTAGVQEVHEDGTTREPHYALGWGKPDPRGTAQSAVGTPADDDTRVPASPSAFTHGGASGTRLWVDPERGLVFAFLTNAWNVTDAPMWAALRNVVLAWDTAGG